MIPSLRFALAALGVSFAVALAPAASAQTLRAAGPPVRVVADGAAAMAPRWSPDGARLAFTRAHYVGLWVAGADGSDVRPLVDWPAAGFGFSWSPDGTRLLARAARYDGPSREDAVGVVDATTGEATLLTPWRPSLPTLPQWTTDRRVVLDARDGVETLDLAGGDASSLAVRPAVAVRPDGLVVLGDDRAPRVIVTGAVLNPVLSSDGTRVAFETMGAGVAVVRVDGSGRVELGEGHRPAWSPDGRWVVLMTTEDDGERITAADLFAARADGSGRVRLTDTPDRLEMNPAWSPDGTRIAYDDLSDGALYVLPVTE